ncbi:hypothetical protein ANN_21261 [Periplaneta americana]|uniref:HTH CENPB-type domain-containing protein n=1 Tax=Periplaneta americana TaxID=6978 RepID=A0ABQ8SFA1_PERAM|nr:hypothetical protein ANN_21261 [Periplaneta americana]
MVFQLAFMNGLNHPFSKNDEAAGRKWLHSFLRRHQELSLRKPQSTPMTRIRGFNQENVIRFFFDIYEPLMNIVNHSPNRLYNCDETDLTVIQHKGNKLVSLKGSTLKAKLLTTERDAAPNGSLAVCHKSGWIQNESFVQGYITFSAMKPTKDDPVFLVLDGHYFHTRNVELKKLTC